MARCDFVTWSGQQPTRRVFLTYADRSMRQRCWSCEVVAAAGIGMSGFAAESSKGVFSGCGSEAGFLKSLGPFTMSVTVTDRKMS